LKLGLASNFLNEVNNIEDIWNLFGNYVHQWLVIDSGSNDGTIEKLHEVAKDKLVLINDNMIKEYGYAYSRTKLIELSNNMDWVLIIDGDERMCPFDVKKLKNYVDTNPNYDIIWMPRIDYLDEKKRLIKYGSGSHDSEPGPYKFEAIHFCPDWQCRLIKRTIKNGKSKIQFRRAVHEVPIYPDFVEIKEVRNLDSPIIEHFKMTKPLKRRIDLSNLCNHLARKFPEGLEEFNGRPYKIQE